MQANDCLLSPILLTFISYHYQNTLNTNAGYSGTPMAKKLGIKDGFHILLYNRPNHYLGLFADLPSDILVYYDTAKKEMDFIHLFCTSFTELVQIVPRYKKLLKTNGMLWISWPKGSSKIPTDLKRDLIREHLLSVGFVDTKVAAIDDDWSGLKFVYRLEDR